MSLRELSSDDTPARLRAALRLKALGARAASPAIAAALNAIVPRQEAAIPLTVPALLTAAHGISRALKSADFRNR